MRKLYLHIGMPKTGSSAIQAFLLLNANELKKKGYYYPNDCKFEQPFQTSSGNASVLCEKFKENSLNEIITYLDDICYDSDCTVLSSEILYGAFRDQQELFFQSLKNFDYRIIFYVRRQDNLYQSLFNQSVKHSNTTDPNFASVLLRSCDYSEILLRSLKYKTPEKILIRPYEQAQFEGGNIYSDFLKCIGLDWDDSFIRPDDYVNPSLNREALLFRIFLNQIAFEKNNWKLKHSVNNQLQKYSVEKMFGKPFLDHSLLSASQRIKIIQEYDDKNSQIARLFLKREDGRLFFDSIPQNSESTTDKMELDLDNINEIIHFINKANNQLIVDLYRSLFEKENLSNEMNNKRKQFLIVIRKELKRYGSRSLYREFKKAEKDFCKRNRLEIKSNSLYVLNKVNFLNATSNFSDDITNGSINIDGESIVIHSVGDDPYWEISKDFQTMTLPIMVQSVIEPPQQTEFQIFYQTKSDPSYSQQKSVKYQLQTGVNVVSLMIADDDFNGKLRIDPGNSDGDYKIKEIVFRGKPKKRELFWVSFFFGDKKAD
jgi:hypothetical protein